MTSRLHAPVLLPLLAGLLLAIAPVSPASAQAQATDPASAPVVTDGHLAAARELIELLRIDETAMAGVVLSLEQQLEMSPELRPYMDVMREWAEEIFTGEAVKEEFARVYAEELSESDIHELIGFYRSPVGQRLVGKQTALAIRGAEVGERLATAGQMDLLSRIQREDAKGSVVK